MDVLGWNRNLSNESLRGQGEIAVGMPGRHVTFIAPKEMGLHPGQGVRVRHPGQRCIERPRRVAAGERQRKKRALLDAGGG